MKPEDKVILVFKNPESNSLTIETTVKEMLEKNLEYFYDQLEPECTCSGCNNESQNFCDCGSQYGDYEFCEIINKP